MKINVDVVKGRMEALAFHFSNRPRAIGQTHAMRVGSDKAECMILAHTHQYARELAGSTDRALTMDSLPDAIRGLLTPILVDHHAMGMLLHSGAQAIRQLQEELRKAKEKVS